MSAINRGLLSTLITANRMISGDLQTGYVTEFMAGRWKEGQDLIFSELISGGRRYCAIAVH